MNICTDRNTSVISAFMPFASRVGAQARAVMVRGLSLRVNRRRQRLRVLRKDVNDALSKLRGKYKLDGFASTDEAMRAIRGRAPGDPYPPPGETQA